MTKTQSTFSVLAITLLLMAMLPMFNPPSAVAQSEAGEFFFGACVSEISCDCVDEERDFCADLGKVWMGDGSICDVSGTGFFSGSSSACCLGDGTCTVLTPGQCAEAGGTLAGDKTPCFALTCPEPCAADIDGDGTVGINDFLDLLAAWGDCS